MERIILTAKDGYIFTNGTDYGKIIYLADSISPELYYQITETEYNYIIRSEYEIDIEYKGGY